MPFVSEQQRKFMWARKPKIARKWADKYGTPKNLPLYKRMSKMKTSSHKGM